MSDNKHRIFIKSVTPLMIKHLKELIKMLVFLIASPLPILHAKPFPISWSTSYGIYKSVCFVPSNKLFDIFFRIFT